MPTPFTPPGGPSRHRPPIPTKGKGKGKTHISLGVKRHRKIIKDTIYGITKGDIRQATSPALRLARRGGVKRLSAMIYNDIRSALKERLRTILADCAAYVEYRNAKTVTVTDVIFSLRRLGNPIYGFDPDTYVVRPGKNAAARIRR
ncbi:histone H4 [Thozetella sp. PMI_491]|nr:histone H4 [Thozetella sp. PMI_491]